MTETNAISTDTVIIRAPDGEEIRWRTQRMIKAGCPLDVAWTITQPANDPQAPQDIMVEPSPADDVD